MKKKLKVFKLKNYPLLGEILFFLDLSFFGVACFGFEFTKEQDFKVLPEISVCAF